MTDFERGGQASIFAIDPSQKNPPIGVTKVEVQKGEESNYN